MMTGGQTSDDGRSRFGKLRLLMFAIVIGGSAAAALISFELSGKISDLREVPRDNVQWNTAQLEVDYLKLERALDDALDDPAALEEFRKRYDIFYSRVKNLEGAVNSLPLDQKEGLRTNRHQLDHFLMESVALVDSPNDELLAALPRIDAMLEEVREAPRRFALGTVQVMANVSDAQRLEIIELLRRLALVTLFVIGALILALAAMTHQRLELSRRAATIVQAGRMQESTLRASLDAIVVIDDQGRITDFNGSAEKVFGFAREEIIGKRLCDTIVPPAFREDHATGFARYTTPDKSGIVDKGRLELIALHKDGHEFPIEISISETQGLNGPNFVSYIRDITEEKLAKAELQQARDDALTAFREKSHFFAVMSHEMRTPLNGIMSALNLMRDDPLTQKQDRYVSIAESSSKVLLSHIDDVLLIERLDSDENTVSLAAFRPAGLVDELAEGMRPIAAEQNTSLHIAHSDPDTTVFGQARAMQQVVMNLMSNAIKFTPSGKVTVSTDMQPAADDHVTLTVTVTDTGIGMTEEDQARIFEDFVTVDTPYERSAAGTGLGLGIVRRLVRQMEGEVTCESSPGAGTTFRVTITLPRCVQETRNEASTEQTHPSAPAAPLSILVVEDNPINSEVLEAMLVREGHTVSLACDGFEGVHMASREHFDLILMDVSMPNMNGIKAAQEIRASRGLSKNSPIYAATAHAMPNEVEEFMAAGMRGCILKPIQPDELRKLLTEVSAARDPEAPTEAAPAAIPTAQSPRTLIDRDTLDTLGDLLGQENLANKLDAFSRESDELMGRIATARDAGNISDLQNHAHRLAGSCGVFGATALLGDLQSLEEMCKSGNDTAAIEMAAGVEETWKSTRKEVSEIADRP